MQSNLSNPCLQIIDILPYNVVLNKIFRSNKLSDVLKILARLIHPPRDQLKFDVWPGCCSNRFSKSATKQAPRG